jgi:hypothetical protein
MSLNSSPWISEEPIKKRIPSIRKTIKKKFEEPQPEPSNGNSDVNNILEKMTALNIDNDGDSLANYNPISYPSINMEKQVERHVENSDFGTDNTVKSMNSTGNFNQVYDNKPYYASSLGIGNGNTDNKIIDRLGYIVHLLEEQQNEKTSNILEEYVLYILLGTFVIFVVDSFSRGGKYIR